MRRQSFSAIFIVLISLAFLGSGAFGQFNADQDPSLVGLWRLNDGSGNIAVDDSPYGNNGTLEGDPQWVAGILDGALAFDGNGDYVDCGNDAVFDLTEQVTLAIWVNANDMGNGEHNAWLGKGDTAYAIKHQNGNNIEFFIYSGTWNSINYATGIEALNGEWHHMAGTFDGSEMVLYIDGVMVDSLAFSGPIGTDTYDVSLANNSQEAGRFFDGILDDARIYSRALTQQEIQIVMLGGVTGEVASDPVPESEATDVPRDVVLSWTAGDFAATHDVYFGTSFEDVNAASRANPMDVLLSQGQADTTFDPPGTLDFEQTYYWRVDEVNAPPDSTIFKGEVWSFTTEPFSYPIQNVAATSNGTSEADSGPEKTVDGSGINAAGEASTNSADMWLATAPADESLYIQYEFDRVYKLQNMLVWNYNSMFELILGFGLKDVAVEYSENGVDWTALGDVEFARATGSPTYTANTDVDFGGVPAKYVRLTVNSAWGATGQYGLSEVRFMYIPAQAREPQPANGATDVDVKSALSWRAGREAVSHEVYLSTDPNALVLVDTVSEPTLPSPGLEFGNTYYWQVVEVNEADAVTAWSSDVWTFSTEEYALIDGFETYNDNVDAGTTIFDTWIDGWVNGNGATVGYFDAPFAERTIVHSGAQSMPLAYDNTTSPFYSEAERTFDGPQDWTGNGADALVLYVRGIAPAFAERANGTIVMNAIGADIWGTSDQFRYAYKNLSGDGSMVVRVDSIVRSNEWAKAGVMIRETLDGGSAHAFMAATPEPAHGLSFQRRPVANEASTNTDVADINLPEWVKLTRTGNIFTAQYSADGVTWLDVTPAAPVDIPMNANVYIGMAVTSHDAAVSTAAEFADVSTTGNVTGDWEIAEIGVAQPVGNSSQPMYVRIEDSAGKAATVPSPNPAITTYQTWQEWAIPYGDLSGVNLSRVEKMVIGVGSATNPTTDGTGTVYIDDIGYGRSPAQ